MVISELALPHQQVERPCSFGCSGPFCFQLSYLQGLLAWIEPLLWSLVTFWIEHWIDFDQPVPCAPHCCVHVSVPHPLHLYMTLRCECENALHHHSPLRRFKAVLLHSGADDVAELKHWLGISPGC